MVLCVCDTIIWSTLGWWLVDLSVTYTSDVVLRVESKFAHLKALRERRQKSARTTLTQVAYKTRTKREVRESERDNFVRLVRLSLGACTKLIHIRSREWFQYVLYVYMMLQDPDE